MEIVTTKRVKTRKVHRCIECQKDIPVGSIAYRLKTFYSYDDATGSYCFYECPRCHYRRTEHEKRLEAFKPYCHHPITFDVWSYIPGECVMQPDHYECLICGAWVG